MEHERTADAPPKSNSAATIERPTSERQCEDPHWIEHCVQRELLSQPHLRFTTLVVRRLQDGVCLQGVVEADADAPDVARLACAVAGVDRVVNQLLVREPPRKG